MKIQCMYHQHLNLNFLNQFRLGLKAIPLCGKQKFGNTIYRSYSQNSREVKILGNLLCERLGTVKIVKQLLEKVKHDSVVSCQLNATIKRLKRKFEDYSRSEPYTASYYEKVIPLLKRLSQTVETFRSKELRGLIDSLILVGSDSVLQDHIEPITSSGVEEVQVLFLEYIKELNSYSAELKWLQDEEAGPGKRVKLTTQVEQFLLQAEEEISKSIDVHDSTDRLLNKWRLALAFREKEECYN